MSAGHLFGIAAWFALFTGLAEVAVWLLARHVLHRTVRFDPQLVWTAPVANAVVYAVLAAMIIAVARGRRIAPSIAIGVFAATAFYTIALLVPRLHDIALLVLAIGLGVQSGRMIAKRFRPFQRLVMRTWLVMAGLVVVLAIAVNIAPVWREWRQLRALPPAADAPNVLLVIWDTVRASSLGIDGYERDTTPYLRELAARSVVFDRAFAPAPWTLATHGSLFTGRWPFELSANWDVPLDDTWPTLAEYLSANGFVTAGFVANHIFGPPVFGLARGVLHYRSRQVTIGTILTSSPLARRLIGLANRWLRTHWVAGRRTAEDISDAFLDWQAGTGDRPFFAFLNLFEAHEPYAPAPAFSRMFGDPEFRSVPTGATPSESVHQDLVDAYDAAIATLDGELNRLLAELERRGVLDNTLVIVTSDHGELFGIHRLYGHGNSLYADELRVPLILSMPGAVPTGLRVPRAVSLRDVPATITDLLGLAEPTPFPGRSLARLWTGSPNAEEPVLAVVPFAPRQPDWYPIADGDMRSVILWPDQFIVRGDGREELFDLAGDPEANRNLLGTADRARLERLRGLIDDVPERVTTPLRH